MGLAELMKRLSIEERLGTTVFDQFEEPHITVDNRLCVDCVEKPCLNTCPSRLYTLHEGVLTFQYEGCVECGTCRVVCHNGGNKAVRWTYPHGGLGVRYREG